MDREDVMYCIGGAMIAIGAGIVNVAAGVACLGAFIALPPLVSLFRAKGPHK